jgi:ABC-2 type transport system permease protein
VRDVSPIFWVGQKLLFILGGLMLPLSFYPQWMQRLAGLTPFPYVLARPGALVLDGSAWSAWTLVLPLVVWGLVIRMLVRGVFRRGTDALSSNGG